MRRALLSGSGSVPSEVLLLLHVSSLPGWSSWLEAGPPGWRLRLQLSLPSTCSLGSRSFTHSCLTGWESPVSGLHCISRLWKQPALKKGGAPHKERPLLSPRRGGRGRGGMGAAGTPSTRLRPLELLVLGLSGPRGTAFTFNMPSLILLRLVNQGSPEYFCLFKTHSEMPFCSLS